MSKTNFLQEDASEMMRILTSAKCIARHSIISADRLSEILTAIVTGGMIVGGNSKGHDILSPTFGLVEVKARILGTDGPFPRVSLKAGNIKKADFFMAVRWTKEMSLYEAIGVPKATAATLYAAKQQVSGLAHIAWRDWTAVPGARSFRSEMVGALATEL
jgi:hypothetical protein